MAWTAKLLYQRERTDPEAPFERCKTQQYYIMSFTIKKSGGGNFLPHPETDGFVRGVIVDITAPKKVQTQYGEKDKFKIVYESEVRDEPNDRQFCVFSNGYTPSLHEKAALRKDLKKIRGRDLTPAEEQGFDMESLIGFAVSMLIRHEAGTDGRTYAKIETIRPYSGDSPYVASGLFTREKDRVAKDASGAAYSKTPESDSVREDWEKIKVHVGNNKGIALGDLDSQSVQKLIDNWLPAVAQQPKQSADDKRLIDALTQASVVLAQYSAETPF